MTRRVLIATVGFAALAVQGGEAYLRIGPIVDGRHLFVQASPPLIRYFVTDRGVAGVTAAQLQTTLTTAGQRWQDVSSAAIAFQGVGLTSAEPDVVDGQNTIGFLSVPEDEDTLGLTIFVFDVITGNMIESDIFFNSAFDWSVDEEGQVARQDLESVAVHELGHMLGLDHSGLGQLDDTGVVAAETVMFPFAFDPGHIAGRELKADDIAGVSTIYPDGGFRQNTGSIRGRVLIAGQPVFGAHVMAFNPGTGDMIAGFTYENGEFIIDGITPGRIVLRIEPMDEGDPGNYLSDDSDLNFTAMFLNRLIAVQAGATTPLVEITVEPK